MSSIKKEEYKRRIVSEDYWAWELAKQKFEEKCDCKPNLSNNQDLLVVSSIQEGILIGIKYQEENKYNKEDLRTSFVSGMESMLNNKLSSEELFQILINKINKYK